MPVVCAAAAAAGGGVTRFGLSVYRGHVTTARLGAPSRSRARHTRAFGAPLFDVLWLATSATDARRYGSTRLFFLQHIQAPPRTARRATPAAIAATAITAEPPPSVGFGSAWHVLPAPGIDSMPIDNGTHTSPGAQDGKGLPVLSSKPSHVSPS